MLNSKSEKELYAAFFIEKLLKKYDLSYKKTITPVVILYKLDSPTIFSWIEIEIGIRSTHTYTNFFNNKGASGWTLPLTKSKKSLEKEIISHFELELKNLSLIKKLLEKI